MALQRRQSEILPSPMAGFENVNRYWDRHHHTAAAKIMPGEFYVSESGEMIVTVLGSCVSACIRDRVKGIGGMNHFMLPSQGEYSSNWGKCAVSSAARYGNWAMEYLINTIISHGGSKRNLEIKIFGGGAVLDGVTDIGQRNIQFVTDYLSCESLTVEASDVGGDYPRKVLYFSDTGAVKLRKIHSVKNSTIMEREREYIDSMNKASDSPGSVELF